MGTLKHVTQGQQLPLDPELEQALVLEKARVLYTRSRYLSGKYASFSRLMEDPIAERCLRLCARQLLRSGNRTQGR